MPDGVGGRDDALPERRQGVGAAGEGGKKAGKTKLPYSGTLLL